MQNGIVPVQKQAHAPGLMVHSEQNVQVSDTTGADSSTAAGFLKKISLLALVVCMAFAGKAQFYYNDVLSANQSKAQYLLLKSNHVKKVKALSYEADGTQSEDFLVEQVINADASKIVTTTALSNGSKFAMTAYYQNGNLVKTEEKQSRDVDITVTYSYDNQGRVLRIESGSADTSVNYSLSEVHIWHYNGNRADTMWKIKENTDTTIVTFVYDDKGNLGEEHWKRKGKETEAYFYYYDAANRLTDIVRYDENIKKMLPDFLFVYDADGRLGEFTQVSAGVNNYLIWRYFYDDKGLKRKEVCFDKRKRMVGKIEYTYE